MSRKVYVSVNKLLQMTLFYEIKVCNLYLLKKLTILSKKVLFEPLVNISLEVHVIGSLGLYKNKSFPTTWSVSHTHTQNPIFQIFSIFSSSLLNQFLTHSQNNSKEILYFNPVHVHLCIIYFGCNLSMWLTYKLLIPVW